MEMDYWQICYRWITDENVYKYLGIQITSEVTSEIGIYKDKN